MKNAAASYDAILDALPAQVALVDSQGVIVAVNRAWRDFAAANALSGGDFGVGQNYIDICDRSRGDGAEEAAAVAAGLRAVLTGASAGFSLEYPCHSPGERRWFRVMVTPLNAGEAASAVVMHVNITERKLVEEELRESEQRYRLLFESNPQPMWVYDLETLRFLAVNDVAVAKYGYSREEFLALTLLDIRPREDAWAVKLAVSDSSTSMRIQSTWRHRLRNGTVIQVEISSHPLLFDGRPARLVLANDVTRREASIERLRTSERELRELAAELEKERFRLVTAQAVAKVGSWETDPATFEVVWSDETYRIFGVDPAQFHPTHEQFLARVHPADRAAVDEAFASSLKTGALCSIEHRILRPDGSERVVEERWRVSPDSAGRPSKAVGTCQDITERRQIQEKLRLGEERFRLVSKATNDAIWDWDLATGELWWNEGFETLFGYRRDEVEPTTESWNRNVHPDDYERVSADILAAIDGRTENWSGEYRFRRKDGSYAYVLDRGYVIRDGEGKAQRMIGGMTDLTERRRAEERLAEQAALLDAAREAILVKDFDDRILYWNKGAEQTYGWTAEEAVGRTSADLLYLDPSPIPAAIATVLAEGRWQGLLRHRTKGGKELDIEASCTLLLDEHAAPKAVLSFNVDITERRQLERQLLRAQRLESIGTMAGGIAHDLNNVLAPVLMAIELLREGETDADKLDLLATMESSAQRGADMVRQVLFFARGVESERVQLDLEALARDVQRIVKETLPKNIVLELSTRADLWKVRADATQLHQVLMNLCVNARDAMPDGGRLTLALENVVVDETFAGMNPQSRPGAYVMLRVADTGSGIPADLQERVFEPFFTTKEVGSGTGLGLSTVHTIVRGHDGFINLYSEPGRGTNFKIFLPADLTEDEAVSTSVEASALLRAGGECILVVDDEENIRDLARRTLERFGYRVIVAANGAEAISIFTRKRGEIAVVLTDMAMPVMDGPATVQALRSIDPQVRVIGSSGLATHDHLAKAVGAGVRHFVSKPYTAEVLLRTLQEALAEGRHGSGESAEISADPS